MVHITNDQGVPLCTCQSVVPCQYSTRREALDVIRKRLPQQGTTYHIVLGFCPLSGRGNQRPGRV